MRKECLVCGGISNVEIKTQKIKKILADNDNEKSNKVFCKYYSLSEINSKAFERLQGSDECFKSKNSCCNCMHRYYSKEFEAFYCFYDYLDTNPNGMYYIQPDKNEKSYIEITIKYWKCPVCNAKNEISLIEKKRGN